MESKFAYRNVMWDSMKEQTKLKVCYICRILQICYPIKSIVELNSLLVDINSWL